MVPNMAGFNEIENMMTPFAVFDAIHFSYLNTYAFPNLKRKFKAVKAIRVSLPV